MSRTYEDYGKLLQSLLPRGKFWSKDKDSVFTQFCNGLGEVLSRVEERSEDLINEAFPTQIQETFEEWEEDFGLPDEGQEISSVDSERRQVIHAKFVAVGGQNPDYFIEIASALGYIITTEGIPKSLAGLLTVGDSVITDENARYYWFVNIDVPTAMIEYFTKANISQLIIDISKRQPAQSMVLFRFTGVEFDSSFSQDFDAAPWYDGGWWPLEFNSEFSDDFTNNTSYNGVRLTGAFNREFDMSFDSYHGGDFFTDEFSSDFSRPT